MKELILTITIMAETFLVASLIVTLVNPSLRVWPPPRRNSWKYFFTWGLTIGSWAGILTLGILDWNSFLLDHWLRFPIGICLIASSLILVIRAIKTLGFQASQGLGGTIVQQGPYQIIRNPQYLANIIMLGGFWILTNSVYAWFTCFLGMVWFIVAPFTEEPWLQKEFGPDYNLYMEKVPRWILLG